MKEKKAKSLESDASKCQKLTELLGRPIEPRKTAEDGQEKEVEMEHPPVVQGQTSAEELEALVSCRST
ncbi:hypothetical protein PBY51_007261 [Eleginops maclovinus]|uniref:Uncharacterized protein n=1 Tax=Eleginops maclovinus TaxID=56733 RepID=A0AAN8AD92_ELEMC|nr:hypothetical protein PBY51_007261 [Eleginops maclovinus]